MNSSRQPSARLPVRIESSLRIVLLVAGVTIIGFGLHAAQPVVVPMLLALCLVLTIQPLVEAIERRGAPAFLAVAAAMLALLMGLSLFTATVVYGANQLLSELPGYEQSARSLQSDATSWLVHKGLFRVAAAVRSTQISVVVMNEAGRWAQELPDLISHGVFVLMLTLFMLIERNTVKKRLVSKLASFAERYGHIVGEIQQYFSIKTLVSALTGACAGLCCYVFDVPNYALWGILAFVFNFIPVVGSFVAAVPPIVLMILSGNATATLAVAGGYAAINLVIGNYLEPRWLGRACGLSTLAVIVSMVVWGALLGATGALLSVPLTSGLRIAMSRIRDFKWLEVLLTDDGDTAVSDPSTGSNIAHQPDSRHVPTFVSLRPPAEDEPLSEKASTVPPL